MPLTINERRSVPGNLPRRIVAFYSGVPSQGWEGGVMRKVRVIKQCAACGAPCWDKYCLGDCRRRPFLYITRGTTGILLGLVVPLSLFAAAAYVGLGTKKFDTYGGPFNDKSKI
jgi:hypothetical protein